MKIMFVCHGNICRSPMGEFILKNLLEQNGIAHLHTVASSAVSREEIGNPVYPPAKRELAKHGISCEGKYAVQLQKSDYEKYDLFLVMDRSNLLNICRIFPHDPEHKIHLLLEFAGKKGAEVDDPWYTRNFTKAYQEIESGCIGLLGTLLEK
ncbi:MAG: low molecular weight protein-tyrosine-phosphatase [Oscillospiraceae bacterium]